MKRVSLILALVLLVSLFFYPAAGASGVQFLSDEMACVKLAGSFIRDVVEGEIEKAFNDVKPYFPITQTEFEDLLSSTRSQLKGTEPNFGKMLGYKFIREERVKDFLVRFTFIIKHELTVTRWRFLFYRPENKWLLNSLHWDDRVDNLFQAGG